MIANLLCNIVDWNQVELTFHAGFSGHAIWRTRKFGEIRVRMLEYSPGYAADHSSSKGHYMLCLEGELDTELADGRTVKLTPGESFQVAEDAEPYRSSTRTGAKLYVID